MTLIFNGTAASGGRHDAAISTEQASIPITGCREAKKSCVASC